MNKTVKNMIKASAIAAAVGTTWTIADVMIGGPFGGGGSSVNTSQLVKAWAMVNYSGATPTLRDSYNVTSIAAAGTGILQINFTTAFANLFYSCQVSSQNRGDNIATDSLTPSTTTQLRIEHYENDNLTDPNIFMVICAGSQ